MIKKVRLEAYSTSKQIGCIIIIIIIISISISIWSASLKILLVASRGDARKNRLSRFREFSYDISHVA